MNGCYKYLALLGTVLVSLVLGACSTVSDQFAQSVPGSPELAQVLTSDKTYQGLQVRWGGVILSVRNEETSSLIEVLQQPLLHNGRPNTTGLSQGRFLIKVNEFVDPEVYTPKKSITVIGILSGSKTEKVGEFDYDFPIVISQMGNYRLWQQQPPVRYYQADPFYDPYWHRPSYYYPYRPSYYHRHHYYPRGSGAVIRVRTR